MKIMMNFPPFKISYFSSFIFQDPLQYNIPSFIHLLHFSTLRELFLRDIGNRVSIFFRGIIFYTIGLVNYFFFFFHLTGEITRNRSETEGRLRISGYLTPS